MKLSPRMLKQLRSAVDVPPGKVLGIINADDSDRRTLKALERRGLIRFASDQWTRVEATEEGRRVVEEVGRV